MNPVNIVIPMKDPAVSKQRLAPVLNAQSRAALSLRLFRQTLAFFSREFPEYPLLVVTASERIERLARSYGARVLKEEQDQGLCQAVALAAQWSRARGFQSQLYVPADIAYLDAAELRLVLACAGQSPQVALCPAGDEGTNALLTSPPDVIPFRFGRHSSRAHQAEANLTGVPCRVLRLPYLTFDIDTPADLDAFDQDSMHCEQEVIG